MRKKKTCAEIHRRTERTDVFDTFRAIHFACDREVAIDNIQEEIRWVVVGLTGESCNIVTHGQCCSLVDMETHLL